ncbi:hypothetical protein RY831_26405 [Noviherbaspirillum sp. CPCC 100848]|uniref:Solute-binding protein family 3/N-terminal domain-containing protein n=1 Tax=Noviherbaspirillum album TaxID=3080276 RepID=A0ABU6JH14_9BURK|nr:hypothetical protein [Noviherbaspirillum sp. CPCC 100848]MEC4722703.1 hypothetical protein [Noviherbaspirillum sp. CPCC 100848]
MTFSLLQSMAAAVEVVPAYNPYPHGPFVGEDQGSGLAFDLVAYLNRHFAGRYEFRLHNVPRNRLNRMLEVKGAFGGVVLFLSPNFWVDARKLMFHWTPPLFIDHNVVVSRTESDVRYGNGESMSGLHFAGVLGHRYEGFEGRFGNDIVREDANSELSNLRKVAAGRADFTILPNSVYRYLLMRASASGEPIDGLHASPKPHLRFERAISIWKTEGVLAADLNRLVKKMPRDPAWMAIMEKYNLR